jgi:hypothetical protein
MMMVIIKSGAFSTFSDPIPSHHKLSILAKELPPLSICNEDPLICQCLASKDLPWFMVYSL